LLDAEQLPFEFIYSYIHILLFLENFNSSSQVVISRCGTEPVLEISKGFFLRTSGSIPKAFNVVSSYLKNNNLSTKANNALEELKSHLKSPKSHVQKVADLEKRLLLFDVDSKSLPIIAKDILNHGYELSLICSSDSSIKEITLALLQNFPTLDEAEQLKIF